MITLQHFYTIVVWCNGSTTGFGSVCRGSNPRTTTRIRAVLVTALILLESLHAFYNFFRIGLFTTYCPKRAKADRRGDLSAVETIFIGWDIFRGRA